MLKHDTLRCVFCLVRLHRTSCPARARATELLDIRLKVFATSGTRDVWDLSLHCWLADVI